MNGRKWWGGSFALAFMMILAVAAQASDIGSSNYSETAASNNATPPNGFPAGMNPAQVHPAAREMMASLKRWFNRIQPVKTSAGTANVQTLTYDVAEAAYVTGEIYRFIVGTSLTNTGAATLNVNALGAKAVQRNGAALVGGELVAGQVAEVYYDGTQFQITSQPKFTKATQATKTTNYTVLLADSGTYFDNTGASGEVDFTLPAYAAGLRYCFVVTAAQTLKVIAPASTTIALGTNNSAAAGNITANKVYSSICLVATTVSNQWANDTLSGTWTIN